MTAKRNAGVSGDLERRYRRWLLAYPAAYRRRQGEELLTTLLDAAPPDRRTPTWREVSDLLKGGLRQRFRLPIGWAPLVVAVFVALIGGGIGSGIGGWLAWRTAAPLPSDAAARDIASVVLDQRYTAQLTRDVSPLARRPNTIMDTPTFAEQWSQDAAKERLARLGWRNLTDDGYRFTAERDGIRVNASGTPIDIHVPGSTTVSRTSILVWLEVIEPPAVPFATVAGWVAGAVGGWQLVGWVWYRARLAPAGRRLAVAFGDGSGPVAVRWSPPVHLILVGLLSTVSLGALSGPTFHTYFLLYRQLFLSETFNPSWGAYAWDPVPTVIGLVAALAATAVAGRKRVAA
ncbi:hypothetical protein [Dactylosporangium sp. CA-233914]|uniref:hypothetical protein n=1 Tax=Dactylosporangium sp. CA-233914 TaxID=3239934 RepID=UPI003D947A62